MKGKSTMKYLDFHQHYGLLEYRKTKIKVEGSPDDAFEKIIIDQCKKLDMVVAVNGCGVYSDNRNGLVIIDKNDKVEKFFKKYPDYIIGMAYIDLDYIQPNLIDEFYKRGFKGIKTIWPAERYDSKKYYEIYKRCEYFGMPILFHTGICYILGFKEKIGACSYNMSPFFLEMIGARFPALQIVGAHLGTGEYEVACAIALCNNEANKNLRFDISSADGIRERIMDGKYIKNYIPVNSVVWGLDEPPTKYEKIIAEWNSHFTDINLTSEERERIFYKNSCDVLGINY